MPSCKGYIGNTCEIIPAASQKFSVPAMPKAAAPATIEHRPRIRELVREKIKELEFKVALELFAQLLGLYQKMRLPATPRLRPPLTRSGKISEIRVFGMRSVFVSAAT